MDFKSAVAGICNINPADFISGFNNAFGKGKTDRKIVEVFGLAIITTWEIPLYTRATGVSSATQSFSLCGFTFLLHICEMRTAN